MSAAETEFRNPETLDYESEVNEILTNSDTHMSVTDIRIELTYGENGIEPFTGYTADDMETAIEDALENSIKPDYRNGDLDGTLSRRKVIYEGQGSTTTISDTEETYRII